MAASSSKSGIFPKKKLHPFAKAATDVISLKQALDIAPVPLIPLSPAVVDKKEKEDDHDQKSNPEEDAAEQNANPKYIKVPTEFHTLHPLRKEIATDAKKGLRQGRKQVPHVSRPNPDYDGDEQRRKSSKAISSSSSSDDEDDEYQDWDKMDKQEAVRTFKLILWRTTYLGMLQSVYAEMEWRYLVSKIPEHEIGIEVAAILFPFLLLLCIWDTAATSYLDLVQMTQIPFFGAFMIVYGMGYPIMLYGYIIRHCYGYYGRTRRSRLAFIGIVLYPLLFVFYCVNDIMYQYSRNEAGIYYHQFARGSMEHPDDYNPSVDYVTLDYRSQYTLGYYSFYDVSPADLVSRVEEEENVALKALSAEERVKIMTMT